MGTLVICTKRFSSRKYSRGLTVANHHTARAAFSPLLCSCKSQDKMKDHANKESSSDQVHQKGTLSVARILDMESSSPSVCVQPSEGNSSSSSWSHLKSYFVGMGFSPTLVEKVIEENGEEDTNLLLEALFTCSEALQKSSFQSLDLPDDIVIPSKAENSSPAKFTAYNSREIEVITNGTKLGLMDKTQQLHEMGFSEDEISSAIEKLGAEVSILEFADSIFANRFANASIHEEKIKEEDTLELKMKMLQSASVIALL